MLKGHDFSFSLMLCLRKTVAEAEGRLSLYVVQRVVFKEKVRFKLWDLMYKESED